MSSSDPVPLILTGGGHFSLSGVKEVAVSEEFLGLGEETTGCQTEQSRADCLTGKYLARALNTCHCAPLNIRSHYDNQVDLMAVRCDKVGVLLLNQTLTPF